MKATRGVLVWACVAAGCVIEYRLPLDDAGSSGSDDADTDEACDDDAGLSCGGTCIDPLTNASHCGGCDVACDAGQVCDAGSCASACSGGRTACGAVCFDLQTDPLHCGECGETCEPGGSCNAGDCSDACNDACDRTTEVCAAGTCECRSGLSPCDGACVDLQRDPLHCGTCDRECGSDPCGGGECQPDGCPAGTDPCGGSCTDLDSDPLHCSECDRTCDADETCIEGECED